MPAELTIPRDRASYDHFTTVSIRYSDQDPMEHVNNVATTAYLESGRFGFFKHLFQDTPLPLKGIVLASLTVDYLQEITFPGSVEVGGLLAAVGNRSMTTHYGIFQGDTCCVVSQSINVFFDPATRRSTNPDPGVRAALEAYVRNGRQQGALSARPV